MDRIGCSSSDNCVPHHQWRAPKCYVPHFRSLLPYDSLQLIEKIMCYITSSGGDGGVDRCDRRPSPFRRVRSVHVTIGDAKDVGQLVVGYNCTKQAYWVRFPDNAFHSGFNRGYMRAILARWILEVTTEHEDRYNFTKSHVRFYQNGVQVVYSLRLRDVNVSFVQLDNTVNSRQGRCAGTMDADNCGDNV